MTPGSGWRALPMRPPSADSSMRSTSNSTNRPPLYTGALDAYLEELYVLPERRSHGLGRALLEAAMEHAKQRGAAHIDLGTSEDDVAARALYESAGFTNREGGPDGPRMLYYERDL